MGNIKKGPTRDHIRFSAELVQGSTNLEEPRLSPGPTLDCMLETLVTAMQTRGPAFGRSIP